MRRVASPRSWMTPVTYAAACLALLLLLLWSKHLLAAWAIAAAGALLVAALFAVTPSFRAGSGSRFVLAAILLLIAAQLSAITTLRTFSQIEFDWAALATAHEARLERRLERRMAAVVERGRMAADFASRVATSRDTSSTGTRRDPVLFSRLEQVRNETRVDALFVLEGPSGQLVAWSGDHRGVIPDEVRDGVARTFYAERPLFSYLYFVMSVPGSARRAVAAVLVETGLVPARSGNAPLTFAAQGDVRATFHAGPGREDDSAWSLTENSDTIVHARLQRVTQADLRRDAEIVARRTGLALTLVALALLAIGWVRASPAPRTPGRDAVPLLAITVAFALAPFGAVTGLDALFSPSLFVLPGDISLGRALVVLIPLAALVSTLRPAILDRRGWILSIVAGSAAIALAYPAVLRILIDAASPSLLEGGAILWYGLQFTAVLALASITALALPRRMREGQGEGLSSMWLLAGGTLLACVALATFTLVRREPWDARSPWTASLWILPLLLSAHAFARYGGRHAGLVRWLVAGGLAATAVLPHLSLAQVNARLAAAERQVGTLGVQVPAVVEFLLGEFGRDALERHAEGQDGLQLLYRSWVASGLAREAYGVRITLWNPRDVAVVELALGGAQGSDAESGTVQGLVNNAMPGDRPIIFSVNGEPEIVRVLTVPLTDGSVITVTVPPRRTLRRASVVAPFLGATRGVDLRLDLVGVESAPAPEEIEWMRAPSAPGWRGDVRVRFPDGDYHAHTEVDVTPLGMRLARGALLFALDLVLLACIWLLGSGARGLSPIPARAAGVFGSFRARVTVALFAFFLVPTALFGWVAYGAFTGEVEHATATIAQRAVSQAALQFPLSGGNLGALAVLAGSDVLRYFNHGELAQVSSTEALGLGVYSAWLSPDVFLRLESGEETTAEDVRQVGEQSYVVAYQALRPAGTGYLAVPIVLSMGETAARQRELAHLVLVTAMMGALLSLALSVAVGRALAGPIGRLRHAAAAVGAGRLGTRLPEPARDEFGQLYASFNLMVQRLRRARSRERRTARVLAWGEVARQVAHEIKNPLTPIKLSVQHLRRAFRAGDPHFDVVLERNVDQILSEIERLSEIASAFSRYGAPTETAGPLEAVDVSAVVREALTLYRAADDAVRYTEDVKPALPRGVARAGELKEVLLNLIENARDALDGSGAITVRARQTVGIIEIEVQDDGPGMAPDVLARVFEPHFSTRSAGTGLGLAIVRRLVEGWGGDVSAHSEEGRGTIMRVRLLIAVDTQRNR